MFGSGNWISFFNLAICINFEKNDWIKKVYLAQKLKYWNNLSLDVIL
jgi:hypothetical protein